VKRVKKTKKVLLKDENFPLVINKLPLSIGQSVFFEILKKIYI